MSRVLEIVLSLSLEGWPVKAASRARGRSVIRRRTRARVADLPAGPDAPRP